MLKQEKAQETADLRAEAAKKQQAWEGERETLTAEVASLQA
jgi:hypothetical protein